MTIEEQQKNRLQFLSRVVARESSHLQQTTERLFATPFTVQRVEHIDSDYELSERTEAFVSRFYRLQDTIGDKLIPQLLNALGERKMTVADNLDKAERLGWIDSADEWLAIRQLRNKMIHEYIEDREILVSAINTAESFVPSLIQVVKKLENDLRERGWD